MCRIGDLWYCQLWRYWIAEDRWERMALDRERSYLWAEYSPDGKTIVFTTMACPQRKCRLEDGRLAFMDAGGANLRLLPGDERPRWGASFSRDGKRLIYWGLIGVTHLSRASFATQSIFEMDLEQSKERRLTPLGFRAPVGMPRYWWDERRFLVASYDLRSDTATGNIPPGYEVRYRMHFVWDFEPGAREWKPHFDSPGDASMGFDMAADKKLLYVAHAPRTSPFGALYVRGVEPLSEPTMILWRPGGLGFYDAAFSRSGQRVVAIPRSNFMDVTSLNWVELWLIDPATLEARQVQYANPQTLD